MGRFTGIVNVDDERLKGFTLDARRMIVEEQLQKQQQQTTSAGSVIQGSSGLADVHRRQDRNLSR
jgi:hypothetical protein